MRKVFSLILVLMLLASSFTSVFAQETKSAEERLATAVWGEVKYDHFGEEVLLKITLTGIVGKQINEYQVSCEDYNVKYLDAYEDDPEYFEAVEADGYTTYEWNGKGELIDNGVFVIPIASGATLTIEVLDADTSIDFYPGYYSFIDDDKKVICAGMGQAYDMSTGSPKTFSAELDGDYDDMINEFPMTLNGQRIGLLIVNADTYPLPTDETDTEPEAVDKETEITDNPDEIVQGLNNFKAIKEYTDDTFADVTGSEWYASDVEVSYEFGIVGGKGNGTFDPEGKITVAEALAMVARTSDIYYGGDGIIENTGSSWYDGIVSYTITKGIIKEGQFTDFNRYATRAELAYLFAGAIAPEEYIIINDIKTLPDVDESAQYSEQIFVLYNSGIITGSDEYGTFNSNTDITRAEAAAIINRVIKPENRKVITLKEKE